MSFIKRLAQLPVDLDEVYYAATRPFRSAAQAVFGPIKWKFCPKSLERCQGCGGIAEWSYMPVGHPEYWCDTCVPRGCSVSNFFDEEDRDNGIFEAIVRDDKSSIDEKPDASESTKRKDAPKRPQPCDEYWHERWGWSKGSRGAGFRSSLIEKLLEQYRDEKMAYYAARQNQMHWPEITGSSDGKPDTSGNGA
ncbi:MAG: hypothetical protein B7Z75_13220 [Acidocella sp. 20-57-95]|nr:MAG: hypothetical protein B7Z75_13220 [Acidocella sp. 20-57-95]